MRQGAEAATRIFRRTRIEEPLEDYLDQFDRWMGAAEELLEMTVDLTDTLTEAANFLTDDDLFYVFRYLPGPPVSEDDLKTLVDASIAKTFLRQDADLREEVVQLIMASLDRRRFPWVAEGREPTEAERATATIATAAMLSMQRVATNRRSTGKQRQEEYVAVTLKGENPDVPFPSPFREVGPRDIRTIMDAPAPGEFCGESEVVGRKADIVVRLWDNRLMPIECKVSNSALNSLKRVKNDAAVKAVTWLREMGPAHIVPAAVLSGVYDPSMLMGAQDAGLTIFWAHDLAPLLEWIEGTRQ